jgi:hypothetical protein
MVWAKANDHHGQQKRVGGARQASKNELPKWDSNQTHLTTSQKRRTTDLLVQQLQKNILKLLL